MFFDEEISIWWCLGDTWCCTPAEAIGLWSVILFYTTAVFVTAIHSCIQHQNGTAERDEDATRRYTSKDGDVELGVVCSLLVYFFLFVAGCLLWVAAGVR